MRSQCLSPTFCSPETPISNPMNRASATELRLHPYLAMRSNRSPRFPESSTTSKGRSRSHTSPSQRTARPRISTVQQTPSTTTRKTITPTPEGPPLVVITPPGSPVRVREPDFPPDMLSSASTSTSDSGTGTKRPGRRRRPFYVANPDQQGPSTHHFVFTPPPLPTLSRHGTRVLGSNASGKPDHSGLHPHTIRSVKSMHTLHSTFDSDGGTVLDAAYWKIPPANLRPVNENTRQRNESMSDSDGDTDYNSLYEKKSPAHRRPKMKEIYDHMETWFPDIDIDKPIIQETNNDLNPAPAISRGKKSIRKVAEEQARRVDRLQRRGTKLWESNMQELKTGPLS